MDNLPAGCFTPAEHLASHVCSSAPPSDFLVKVVEVSDSSQQKTLRGHEAPVLSVAMDPKDVYLVGYRVNVSNTAIFFAGLGHSYLIDLWSLWAVRCSGPMRLDVCCSLGNTLVLPIKGSYAVTNPNPILRSNIHIKIFYFTLTDKTKE